MTASSVGDDLPAIEPPPPFTRRGIRIPTIACRVLAIAYGALSIWHLLTLDILSSGFLSGLAGVSALALFTIGEFLSRGDPARVEKRQDLIVFTVASIILANSLARLSIEVEAQHSINVLLLVVGAACFMRSGAWFSFLAVLAITSWTTTAIGYVDDFDVLHYGFPTFLTLALSGLIFASRRDLLEDVETHRSIDRDQNDRLRQALTEAKSELCGKQETLDGLEITNSRNVAIIEVASNAIVIVDGDDQIQEINSAAAQMFGFERSAFVGKTLTETIIPDTLRDAHISGLEGYLRSRESSVVGRAVELTAMHALGHEFPVEVMLREVQGPDEPPLFAGFISDLTERKSVEEDLREARDRAEEGSRAKSQFLARMSHEIRTPLNAIMGLTELAMSELQPGRSRDLLERGRGAGEYLSAVLGDLLDLAKVEAGRLEVDARPISPRHLLEEACDFLSIRAAERGLDLVLDVDPNVPTRLIGDPTRIRQIVTNLVGNAIKFTPRGWVRVAMMVVDDRLHIEVEDTGVGIAPDLKRKIFEEFEQGEEGRENNFGGTGLGLTISRRLSSLMGGVITLEDRLGGGSRFSLILPYEPAHARPAKTDLSSARVILALPLETERLAIRHNLEQSGPKIEDAKDLPALRELLSETSDEAAPQGTTILFDIEAFPLSICPAPAFDWIAVARSPATTPPAFANSLLSRPLGPRGLARALNRTQGIDDPASPSAVSEAALVPARILVVEDNEINQIVLAETLRNQGKRVKVAPNGLDALMILETHQFDAILLDVEMPGIDGFETLVRIRRHPKGARTPVIAVTAYATQDMRARTLESGFDGFISKPISSAEIGRVLAEHLPPAPELSQSEPKEAGETTRKGPPVIERDVLLRNTEGNRDMIHKLAEIFARTGPVTVDAIRVACQEESLRSAQRSLHKIQGTLADIGAAQALSIAQEMSKAGQNGKIQEIVSRIEDLDRSVSLSIDALARFAEDDL